MSILNTKESEKKLDSSLNELDFQYQEAVNSLKKINNELFYDELKQNLKDREDSTSKHVENITNLVAVMEKQMKRLPEVVNTFLNEGMVREVSSKIENEMGVFNRTNEKLEGNIKLWKENLKSLEDKNENILNSVMNTQKHDHEWINERLDQLNLAITHELAAKEGKLINFLKEQLQVMLERHELVLDKLQQIENNEALWKERWELFEKVDGVSKKNTKVLLYGVVAGQLVLVIAVIGLYL